MVLVLGAAAARGGWAAARCAAVSSGSAGEPLACGAALDQERLWKDSCYCFQTSPRGAIVVSAARGLPRACFEHCVSALRVVQWANRREVELYRAKSRAIEL